MDSTPERDERALELDRGADGNGAEDSHRAMIRMLLRQTPEQRLRGLVNAARFFANAHRG